MRFELQSEYPGIGANGYCSYGGNQMILESETLRRFGCGAVAMLDLVRYLHLYHNGCKTDLFTGIPDGRAMTRKLYSLCIQRLCRRYLPIMPYIATNGVFLSAGINAYFKHYSLPFSAHWSVSQDKLWEEISRMLRSNLPVILAIGKPVKKLLGRKGIPLYQHRNGELKAIRQVNGHFVTITGQENGRLHISSWGKEYVIDREELMHYAKTESLPVLCNILQICPEA